MGCGLNNLGWGRVSSLAALVCVGSVVVLWFGDRCVSLSALKSSEVAVVSRPTLLLRSEMFAPLRQPEAVLFLFSASSALTHSFFPVC